MLRYLIRRLALLVVTLFGITAITFLLTRLTPGDPAEMKTMGTGGGARSMGGFDDMVENNRRNLGLDRPTVLNFRFEDRRALANRAIDDLFRPTEFWQKDAEKRLARVSTIALGPALERYPLIGAANEPVPKDSSGKPILMASAEHRREALAKLLPRLANEPAVETANTEEAYSYWKNWFEEHQYRFDEDTVRQLVVQYSRQADDAKAQPLFEEVRAAGGIATPYLLQQLGDEGTLTKRVNLALETSTGFSFAQSTQGAAADEAELIAHWRSWWRRDGIYYQRRGAVGRAWSVISDTQFALWVRQATAFDFGESYAKKRTVTALIAEALPISALISGLSILISYLIAIPLGIMSAMRRHKPDDTVITVILFILYSLPSFWAAAILLLTTTGKPFLALFPARGISSSGLSIDAGVWPWMIDRAWHLVLPVLCLTYGSLAFLSRQMRSAMLESISQDYIRTARAKGLSWRSVVFKHALRNSLIPVITLSAGLLPELIAGSVIVESIFTIPGMGLLTIEAITNRDYPIINAVVFFSAFLTLIGILLSDIATAMVDPRVNYL
ncbi:hypothetical protein BH09SUM1_BH09SUM1_16040 [soil metagenome]